MNASNHALKCGCYALALAAFGAAIAATAPARADTVIKINPRTIRGRVGTSFTALRDLPLSTPDRRAVFIDLRVGVSPVAGIYTAASGRKEREPGFSLYDELFMHLALGGMVSEPQISFNEPETRLSARLGFGWELAAGWQLSRVGVWAGMRVAGEKVFVGGSSLPGDGDRPIAVTFPLLVRADVAVTETFHLIAMPWASAFGAYRSVGGEVEASLTSRLSLGVRADHLYGGDVGLPNTTAHFVPGGAATTATLYLRVGTNY